MRDAKLSAVAVAAQELRRDGVALVRGAIDDDEIERLRRAFDEAVAGATAARDPDAHFAQSPTTQRTVFAYLSHVLDKRREFRLLMAHPSVREAAALVAGPQYISTSEFLVGKVAGDGWHVRWHRDVKRSAQVPRPGVVLLAGIALDPTDETNCVWVIPGSQHWSNRRATQRRDAPDAGDDAVPMLLRPGDLLLTDVLLLHASPHRPGNAARRTAYFIFRPAALVLAAGRERPEYVERKLQVVAACNAERAGRPYAAPPTYRLPSAEFRAT